LWPNDGKKTNEIVAHLKVMFQHRMRFSEI
jgi:hypothetical protein